MRRAAGIAGVVCKGCRLRFGTRGDRESPFPDPPAVI
jgi:hypothetical protein